MKLQLEINGEPYTGSAFKTNDGILIHLPGVQAPSAAPFETLFQGVPEHKLNGGFLEAGEWNGKEFPFETQVTFGIGPDGKVWAQVCGTPGELPDAGHCCQPDRMADDDVNARALRILDEADEAFDALSMAKERAANGGWPAPVTINDILFWLEDEATIQEIALNRSPQAAEMDKAYVRALRGVADELRELGFTPSPAPWANQSTVPLPVEEG